MIYDRETVKAWAGDSQWKALQADFSRFRVHGYTGWGSEGFWALSLFRFTKIIQKLQPRWAWTPVLILVNVLKKILVLACGVDLNPTAEIGAGLLIPHGAQIRVGADTVIGADCAINHLCTIGAGKEPGSAKIGDHVYIAPHAVILGPVTIGDGATIGASSLVITDVPAGHTAVGVPARILPMVKDKFGYNSDKVAE